MAAMAEELSSQAENLKAAISFFKVNDSHNSINQNNTIEPKKRLALANSPLKSTGSGITKQKEVDFSSTAFIKDEKDQDFEEY